MRRKGIHESGLRKIHKWIRGEWAMNICNVENKK